MESFGINPMGRVDAAYTWKFDNLKDARCSARELCEKHHVEVVVFKIIGTYKPTVLWVGDEG